MIETVRFKLNGENVHLNVDGERMLLWVLRTDLGLTGTKYGCGREQCGACTVLVDGDAVLSCQMPVREVQGQDVVTIEGLSRPGEPHPLQKAFMEHDALQCGFCTPGMILGAYSLLRKTPLPTRQQIIGEMEQHLCRCGSYPRVIRAVEVASRDMKGGKP